MKSKWNGVMECDVCGWLTTSISHSHDRNNRNLKIIIFNLIQCTIAVNNTCSTHYYHFLNLILFIFNPNWLTSTLLILCFKFDVIGIPIFNIDNTISSLASHHSIDIDYPHSRVNVQKPPPPSCCICLFMFVAI